MSVSTDAQGDNALVDPSTDDGLTPSSLASASPA